MLYIYYMKNNFLRWVMLAVWGLFPALLAAEVTVVRIEGATVYLDISSAKQTVQPGQPFKVILSAEKLVNPKTGKNLGNIYKYSAQGALTEVQPLYAVGQVEGETSGLAVGQEAVLTQAAAPVQTVSPQPTGPNSPLEKRRKTVYAPVEQTLISVTEADVSAPNAHNLITLSEEGQVTVWSRGGKDTLTENLTYQLASSLTPITLSAAPVKEGLAQIFVTVYSPSRKAISALVLENQNGKLEQTASLPYFVKEMGCGQDKTVWAQKPFVAGAQPANARELLYKDGEFTPAKASFSTRRNWLLGLTRYDLEKPGSDNLIYTASNGTINVRLANGKQAQSEDLFATSPNRVKYKQEILKFYPSVQVFGPQGGATVAAVENDAKIGLLAKMFGQYRRGKIHFMTLEKGRLSVTDTTPLDGVVYDTACSDRAILAAEVLPDGTSSVVEIFK